MAFDPAGCVLAANSAEFTLVINTAGLPSGMYEGEVTATDTAPNPDAVRTCPHVTISIASRDKRPARAVSEAPHIDELLDRAFQAINAGDRATANVLAEQVLALDEGNADAEDLLAAPAEHGEIRRLTIMFADLVDSTALSTRIEPEVYRTVVGRYRDEVLRLVGQYEGHIGSTKGDGLLAFFGHPQAHEDDVQRAVQAGLDITRAVTELSERVRRRFGFGISVRVGIHRGIVYLDTAQDDVYGLAANLAARICSIAEPGTVAVSEAVEPLIRGRFELEAQLPKTVKGVDAPVRHFRVVAERDPQLTPRGPVVGRERELAYIETSWTTGQPQRTTNARCGFPR